MTDHPTYANLSDEERAGLDAREKGKARQRLLRWFRAIDNGALPPPVATASLALDAIEAEAVAAERVRLLPFLRHRATCALQAVRDNHPADEECTCGLREVWAAP